MLDEKMRETYESESVKFAKRVIGAKMYVYKMRERMDNVTRFYNQYSAELIIQYLAINL